MKLYRAFATVGGLTLVSRVLGFLRDILFAWAFGSGMVADAFNVAFRFPNLFRRLFGEGAFNSAFIPLFAKELESGGREAARSFAEEAMSGLFFVLVVLSAACMIAMPWLMYLLAPGFSANPEKYDLAVLLTQIAFPYLLCMSLVALYSGVLNSFGKFVESSCVSIVLNLTLAVALIGGAWLGYHNSPAGGVVQAIAVLVAGVLQLLLLLWGLRRNDFWLRLHWPRMTDRLRRLITLGIPGVVAGGVTQLNIMIGTMIASMQPGAVSQLYYADRLYELPLAIVGIAVGVVLLPDVARSLRAGDHAAVIDSQNRSLEFAMLLTVPAALALAVVPGPIVTVLFERGAFTATDTAQTSSALWIFALGLPAFVMIKVFSPSYFAREDTKTPMRYATISLVLNTIGSVALFFLFRSMGLLPQLGIAVATTLGGWLNAGLLWSTLRARGEFEADGRLVTALTMILLSALVMCVVLHVVAGHLAPLFGAENRLLVRAGALATLVGAGLAAYGFMIVASGTLSLGQLSRFLRRRA